LTPRINPRWTLLADTLEGVPICRYRPIGSIVVDGTRYFFNGWNQPWYIDLVAGKLFPLGSRAPTTFALALSAAGAPAALPTGRTAYYYVVFRNDDRGEETAPQVDVNGVAGISIANGTGTTRDVTVTWVDPGDGRWLTADIYKQRYLSSEYVRVASVDIATGTYLDVTPDANLSTATSALYVTRWRTTLPPAYKVLSAHLGRILAITGKSSVIDYSQPLDPAGELLQVDFPVQNKLIVEGDDGLGDIVLIFAHYDTTIVVKERGAYLLEGDPADNTIAWRRMYADRGALSPRSFLALHSSFAIGDGQGLYGWTPSAEPAILGTRNKGNAAESPLSPFWRRVNRGAAGMVHLAHRQEQGTVEFYAPIDYEPIAMRCATWYYRENRFDGIDDRVALATGTLSDRSGAEHDCYLDDLGYIWERDQSRAQGVESGGTRLTSIHLGTLPGGVAGVGAIASGLAGVDGVPTIRRDAAGVLIQQNRAFMQASSTAAVLLYWSGTALDPTQTLDFGVIPFTPMFAARDFGTGDKKTIPRFIVRFRPQSTFLGLTPTLNVYTGNDERGYTLRRAIDLTNTDGWAIVPCWDRGFKWNVKMEASRAGDDAQIEALTIDVLSGRVRR
jgi:hypothetical protein